MIHLVHSSLHFVEAKTSIQNAKNSWSKRRGLLLQLQDQRGNIGLGEASPLPGYSPDSLEEAAAGLEGVYQKIAPFSADLSARTLVEGLEGLSLCASARFALETALLDLLGQHQQKSIAQLLCDTPRERVSLNALLSLSEVCVPEAQRLAARGYRAIKLKLGLLDFSRELSLLQRLREALPSDIELRVDANGSWKSVEAPQKLRALRGLVSFVEQPVAAGELVQLGEQETPWAADESLQSPLEAEAIFSVKGCCALVLKPMVLGGFLRCIELAERAKERGLAVLVTHAFDGPVALAASRELARAIPGELWACGLDEHQGVEVWPPIRAPHQNQDGAYQFTDSWGLGLSKEDREKMSPKKLNFLQAARDSAAQEALIWDEKIYTYGELEPRLQKMCSALRRLGVQEDSLVAVCANNSLETFLLIAALLSMGTPFIPIHPRLTREERQVILDDARPTLYLEEEQVRSLSNTASAEFREPREAADDSLLAIMYTSGTTGVPKGAMLTRGAFLASAAASEENLGWRPEDRWLLCMPLCHIGGLSILTRCLLARRCVVLQPRFEASRVLRALREQEITLLSVVPTMLKALLESDTENTLSGLRAVLLGGAAAPESLLKACAERKIQALTTYGLTEACSQVTTQRPKEVPSFEPGCGVPLAGVELAIIGEDGQRLPRGEVGQIKVRGPSLMRGYLHREALTSEGLFTGDLGLLDEEGRLHIVARRTDLIVTGGENVYPLEVERALERCTGVTRALVFGVFDETWGQLVAVALEVSSGFDAAIFRGEIRERLAKHKRPRLYCVVKELPVLASGKPDRAGAPSLLGRLLLPVGAGQ